MKLKINYIIAALISYVSLSNAQLQLNQRWKERNGGVVIVPYTTTSKSSRPTDDARRNAAIKLLNEQAKAVKLVERKRSQKAYVEFRNDTKGCYSDVGRIESGTKQILNLDSECMSDRRLILQELLYALGMFPEHNRKDRDQFVTINLQNVPEKLRHNFDIIDDLESSDLGTPYDYESITHYTDASVITTKNGSSIEERDELSQIDILELRLMYQCLSGPRSFSEYNSNPCTSDCKCWEGAVGCGVGDDDDDDSCMGDLKCVNNICTRTEASRKCNDVPSNWVDSQNNNCAAYATIGFCEEYGDSFPKDETTANEACCVCGGGSDCTDEPSDWVDSQNNNCQAYTTKGFCEAYGNLFPNDGKTANEVCCACGGGSNIGTGSDMGTVFINLKNTESPNLCITLRDGSTSDGTALIHSQCIGGSNQKWYWDANNYIHSALDINKCIVGSRGSTNQGTNLVINTCFANDDRFKWNQKSDLSIRPFNNDAQCVSPSAIEQSIGIVLYMSDCDNARNQQWRGFLPTLRERVLQTANCEDDPPGWYNSFGDNCEWYSEDTNCEDYGSGLSNFGKTANQACCACGGGSARRINDVTPDYAAVDQKCWDTISDWVDSVGDGCFWYGQGNNCQDYGNDFRSAGLITVNKTAKEVCCACGGGSSSPPASTREVTPDRCSDSPSRWVDDNNDGCGFYAIADNCEKFGDQFRGLSNKTANEACCACGGGLSTMTRSRCGLFNLGIFCPLSFCGVFGRLIGLCKN